MNRIYRVIWNCTLQVFQACSELTRRAGKTSTVNLRKSSGLTTKFSRLTLGVLLALSGSASGASLEVDNDQITNIDTDVAYDAYLVGWYGTGVLNILAGGNASLTTITTSVIGANEDSEGTVNVLGGTWRLYDSGNNARPLNVGQSGTGTLNIKQKGHVDGGYLRLGSSTGGVGTVNVEGEDSVLTTELFEIGSYGTGSLNITDKGYVTSSIVAILGYQAGSNGQVVVEKGGEWLIKNNDSSIEFQIGNQGTGEATIREGGLITAENTIIGGNATGIGTLNVQDQDSVITVRRLYNGYFGNGTLNISNNGLINNKEYSLVGVQDGSHGVVNVTDKGHWNFLGTGEAFVNVSNGATLNSTGYGFIGGNASGKGIVNISTDSLWNYISNIAAANSLFSHRLHDRLGEPQYIDSLHSQGSASSMWMRHVGGHERSRAGDGQLNTQANRYVLQLGGDLAQWSSNAQDRWHLGVMAGYANQHSNTQSNRVGYKSDGRISGYSAGLYATWYQNDANKTGAYVDSWALYNWFDNSVSSDNRSADDYDSRGVTASVEGGYTFEAGTFSGSEETLNTWYVQPQAQITWMGVKDSDHTRKDGTRIETEGDGNVQTRLGVKTYLNSHHQRDDGKQREFQPYIEANWINNSKVYAVKMNGQTVGREGARNLGEVRTGVEAKVNNNLSLWGNVGVQLGDKGYSDTQGMLGVKYSW
ncbi:autotransporter outer membrane beta-barrel domain-containing protein [Escherichia coli]|uniref:autotransporter outer membrane beta-barrel domain-containing protein n=1 Tax=Escherichia coli TaxID=562 RepID=UPI0010CAD8D3|nr:autotransporter outer membrane beta-barrel domain-containing protein [Escherichia coli]GDO89229.1 autotransporter protein [Escherichia coli]